MQKSTTLANFCNSEIPELRRCQSRHLGLAKTAEIPGFRISGLQYLVLTHWQLVLIADVIVTSG